MNTKHTGGPAFPILPPLDQANQPASAYPYVNEGVTKRDYFAAHALTGLLANKHAEDYSMDGQVSRAYDLADAMIAERSK